MNRHKRKKTLILVRDKESYFWGNYKKNPYIDVEKVYIRKFTGNIWVKKRNGPENNYKYYGFFGNWIFKLKNYEKIIVLDSAYSNQMDTILKNTEAELYFFYWNGLHKDETIAGKHLKAISDRFKIYSYNRYDCDKYGLGFNTTMYSPQKVVLNTEKVDLIFIGYVFGKRLTLIDLILDEMKKCGYTYKIYAVIDENRTDKEYVPRNYELMDKGILYNEYIEQVAEAKVILDVDKYNNVGCSLRAMESIFYQRKLITTNKRITEEYFYDSNNVYIWGVDSLEKLHDFMTTPYKRLKKEIVEYYKIDEWVKRFEKEM